MWKIQHSDDASFWSHMLPAGLSVHNHSAYSTAATFYDDETVVVSDSSGYITFAQQQG